MYLAYAVIFAVIGGSCWALIPFLPSIVESGDALALIGFVGGVYAAGIPLALTGLIARWARITTRHAVFRVAIAAGFGAALCFLWSYAQHYFTTQVQGRAWSLDFPPEVYASNGLIGASVSAIIVELFGWSKR
jgi:hypothetical protein